MHVEEDRNSTHLMQDGWNNAILESNQAEQVPFRPTLAIQETRRYVAMEVGGWKICNRKDKVQGCSSPFLKKCMNKGRKAFPIDQHGRSVGKNLPFLQKKRENRSAIPCRSMDWRREESTEINAIHAQAIASWVTPVCTQKRCSSHRTGYKCPHKGMLLGRYVSGKQAIPKNHQNPQHDVAKSVVC